MAPEKDTFSSNQLRERDQAINDRYQKELNSLHSKCQTLRRNYDEILKTLHDEKDRGLRLARCLGYAGVLEALVELEPAEYEVSFREYLLERVQMAGIEVIDSRKELEALKAQLWEMEQEAGKSKAEKKDLEAKYDALLSLKKRAEERYKADYKKWKAIKVWVFSDESIDEYPGVAPEDKKKLGKRSASIQRKREMLVERSQYEGDPASLPSPLRGIPPFGRTEIEMDKENEETPMPPPKRRRISTDPPVASPMPLPRRNALLQSVTNFTPPSASPTLFSDAASALNTRPASQSRVPLSFKPIADVINIKQEPSPTPIPVSRKPNVVPPQSPLSSQHIPGSSDTEDDSQAIFVPATSKYSGKPVMFRVPAPPPTSGPSYWDERLRNSLHASLPARPSFGAKPAEEAESSRRRTSIAEPMRSAATPQQTPSNNSRPQVKSLSASAKGKERTDENQVSTPSGSKPPALTDYSAYKGRGRYGKANEAAQPTINAMYTIDPKLNGGQAYQYDEVVRRKDDRRKLDAGDCECCREYYEGVGPLPARLEPPLWRSPPTTPAKPCLRHPGAHAPDKPGGSGDAMLQSEIEGHKKAISRHRQSWARAKTPPGYWNIGFPDTQEAGNINEKAREMHKRKQDEVDREAGREGGRYRRR